MTPAKKTKAAMGPDFGKRNYIFLGIGLFLIIVGFIVMGTGDITISPIMLVLGYCVAIPLGILLPAQKGEKNQPAAPSSSERG